MANAFDQPFSSSSAYASGNTSFKTKKKGTGSTKWNQANNAVSNPFNQSFNATGDAPNQDYSKKPSAQQVKKQQADAKVKADNQAKEKANSSLIGKIKKAGSVVANGGKAIVKGGVDTAEKSVNTVGAGVAGVTGLTVAGAQAATGHKAAAKKTVAATNQEVDEFLTKGAGKKGAYLTPKQASSSGGGTKSLKENFIKPTSQAVSEITPWVAPVGKTAKGASLLTKVVRGAVDNMAVTGGTTVGNEAVQGRLKHDNGAELAKQLALAGVVGAVVPLAGHGAGAVKEGVTQTGAKEALQEAKRQSLLSTVRKPTNSVPEDVLRESQARKVMATDVAETTTPQTTTAPASVSASAERPGAVGSGKQKPVSSGGMLPEDHGQYFNVQEKQPTIPVDQLKTLPGDAHNNPTSVGNAAEFMRQAAAGEVPKRDPILVHAADDGTHTVLDGNATTHAARTQGWKDLPTDVVTSKARPGAQHVDAVKTLVSKAREEDPQFQANVKEVADGLGLQYKGGPPKDHGRTLTKVMDDYGGDHTKVKDTIRGTITVDKYDDFDKVISGLKSKYGDVKVKDGYKGRANGYADVKVTVTTPGGHKGEIILATPEMLHAKETGGHDLYKIYRDESKTMAERKAAFDQMNTLYGNAHESANRRLASSADLLASSSRKVSASASETSRKVGSGAGNDVSLPETTTRSTNEPSSAGRTDTSTSSGVMKNDSEPVISKTIADAGEKVKDKQYNSSKVEKLTDDEVGSVRDDIQTALHENAMDDAEIVDIKQVGSTAKGTHTPNSDYDFMVVYKGDARPDDVFNAVSDYAEKNGLELNGRKMDFNPVKEGDTKQINELLDGTYHQPPVEAPKPATAPKRTSGSLISKTKKTPATDSAVSGKRTLTPVETAHMESFSGYTHSSVMEKDYADMLRNIDETTTGGQMIPDGEGGYIRTSEHSPFYRAYYKEFGRKPSRAAYLEEAQRQLKSGRDEMGAGEDYKQLLERESKPIPQMKIDTSPRTIIGKTKTSTLASKVEARAVSAKLTKDLGDLPQYSEVNMKEQGRLAADLLANDEQKANRIAFGQEVPPADLLPEAVYTAVEQKAVITGDIETIRQLANSKLVSEATTMGQRIRALGERDPDSAVSNLRTVANARVKRFEDTTGKTAGLATRTEAARIKAATRPVPVRKETWESFIEGLKC